MTATMVLRSVAFVVGIRLAIAACRAGRSPGAVGPLGAAALRVGAVVDRFASRSHPRGVDAEVATAMLLVPVHWVLRLGHDRHMAQNSLRAAQTSVVMLALCGGCAAVVALGIVAVPASAVGLAIAPSIPTRFLGAAVQRERCRASSGLPADLDLLSGALASGVPLAEALKMLEVHGSPSARRIAARASELVAEGVSPVGALQAVAKTAGIPALTRVAGLIARGVTLGSPVANSISAVAADLRGSNAIDAERRAGRMAPIAALLTAVVIAPACIACLAVLVIGGALSAAPSVSIP